MKSKYTVILEWSEDDALFLVTIPEFAELVLMPCTHGKTRLEALRNAEEVLDMYLEVWQAEGTPIPLPRRFSVLSTPVP
jgi:predicted RNase H-like HicB family nuclease